MSRKRIEKRAVLWKRRPNECFAVSVVALSASLLSGCSNTCLDNSAFYEQKVWTQVVSKNCLKCHAPEGVAANKNAKFIQLSQSFPSFLDINLANISDIAKIQFDGTSELLRKPLGEMDHGGGSVLPKDSDEYKILSEMVDRANKPVTCSADASSVVPNLGLLDPVSTLRKATLQLSGRLPTSDEEAAVAQGGEEALSSALDTLMTSDNFFKLIKEIYGDVLLTGRYNQYDGQALGLLNDTDYPSKNWWNPTALPDNMLSADQRNNRKWVGYAIAAEPLELIAYVARNNKPFTEILTANYTVVNWQSAQTYGVDPKTLGLNNAAAYYDFRPTKVQITRNGSKLDLPHAGVITTPAWLNRWPTTSTNVNRARARMTYKFFLATDLLAVAERPIDPSSVTSTNPTRDDQYCTPCHKVLDPVASTFQKFDANGRFQPTATDWPLAMPQPGFGAKIVDSVAQYPLALQWLGGQVSSETRFGMSVLTNLYQGIIGQTPLPYPSTDDPEFDNKVKSWREQNRLFQSILTSFSDNNYNVKEIVKGLIMSPIYRTDQAHNLSPGEMEPFGTGRLVTPESLARQIPAVTGVRWVRYDRLDILPTDYNILYGGIDSDNVVKRLTVPNALIANVGQRMANEVSCSSVAWDLMKPQAQRLLFPFIEVSQVPEDDNGFAVPASVDNIRKNIQHLTKQFWGDRIDASDPEIDRTYKLFLETFRELHAAKNTGLPYECQGLWDQNTGASLPMTMRGPTDDKYFTIRSWMAVISYMMLDWRYLYQ